MLLIVLYDGVMLVWILYGQTMRTVHKLITLFATLLLLLLLLLIVIYDYVATYNETIIIDLYVGK